MQNVEKKKKEYIFFMKESLKISYELKLQFSILI